MRRIVVVLVIALTVSGVALGFGGPLGLGRELRQLLSIVHTWAGWFFLVLFPLYAWDHIRANRQWLRVPALVTFSGAVQALAAAVLILSGLVLLAYGVEAWPLVRRLHHWLTYVLAGALTLHFLSPKAWRA